MFTKEEIKTYNQNIKENQVKTKCSKCGLEMLVFPEHKEIAKCECGGTFE